jgi:hypothetical protein
MQDRTIKGSADWQQRDFVVDVPEDSNMIMVGFWMQGKGQVWMRDMNVEEVANTVALTPFSSDQGPDLSLPSRAAPGSNDRFQPPPEKWLAVGGQGFELCDNGVDAQLLKAGQRNLTIACSISAQSNLRQAFVAAPYWGKRVRFSGWIRTEKVEPPADLNGQGGGAGLYMSATDSQNPTLHANAIGTTAWQYKELVMDIPRNSAYIPIGIALYGRGQVWGRDFKFEEVSLDTPVTTPNINP